jgi:hypothetical protein
MTADFRVPRGYAKVDWPFLKRYEDGSSPSYPIYPAKFLPVAFEDKVNNDPIVLLPGTWVGRLDRSTHSALDASFLGNGDLVPACPNDYTITYTSLDVDADNGGVGYSTPDIDEDSDTAVAATGASTATVVAVKPLGVTLRPMYANWLNDKYVNYKRDLIGSWKSRGFVARIPCITANEAAIRVGDVVMLDNASSPTWNPTDNTANIPGRLKRLSGATLANVYEWIVGRCVEKVHLGKQDSASAGQTLRAAIGTGAPRTLTNFDSDYLYPDDDRENWREASKIIDNPGIGLGPSEATLGREPQLLYARADSSGDFWAIDIEVNVV